MIVSRPSTRECGSKRALENPEEEESQNVLAQYDPKVIEFVSQNDWGDYILFPDRKADGSIQNFKGTSSNLNKWNTEKYMIGTMEEGWLEAELDDDAISTLAMYFSITS